MGSPPRTRLDRSCASRDEQAVLDEPSVALPGLHGPTEVVGGWGQDVDRDDATVRTMSLSGSIEPTRLPSLDVVEAALAREEDSYRQRAQSIDTRLGLLLGAAGVLVAFVGGRSSIAGLVGQVVALAAGGAAVLGLWPRVDKGIAPRKLRDRYLAADPTLTRMRLLNTRLELHEKDEVGLMTKARRLRAAALLLLSAATTIVVGSIVEAF